MLSYGTRKYGVWTNDEFSVLERASRSALMKYIIYSLIYVSTTNIYWSI